LSHTKALVEEGISKALAFLEREHFEEISQSSVETLFFRSKSLKSNLEKTINRLGYHLAKADTIKKLENYKTLAREKLWAVQTFLAALTENENFDLVYSFLGDEPSRETFDWFIKARVAFAFLGNRAFDLFPSPVDKQLFERGIQEIAQKQGGGRVFIEDFRLKSPPQNLFCSFISQQYRLPGLVEPKQGDWVFDIGGCFGETSFWFSRLVGENGKIFCFEPVPENYKVLEENLRTNRVENIVPVQMAVGDFTGEVQIFGEGGSAAISETGSIVPCITIDEFVSRLRVEKVDMIKMDIEGSELKAIKGAAETLKRFKPKLAISVYHRGEDCVSIPLFIESLKLGYMVYLRNFTPFYLETILFATTKPQKGSNPSL